MAGNTYKRPPGASSLGEDGIIELVRREFGAPGPRTLIGIGDDAAAISAPPSGAVTLITTDMMAQGTHFSFEWASPWQVGWKALASAASDIGAMGGRPVAAVISVGLTGAEKQSSILELARGIKAAAVEYGIDIAGGDTVHSGGGMIVSVTVTGEAPRDAVVKRSGARPGHAILIAGTCGQSAAGLELLRRKGKSNLSAAESRCIEAHLAPRPLIREGMLAAATGIPSAMMDLSDGLAADLPRLCQCSNTGAILRAAHVPVSPDTIKSCRNLGLDPLKVAIAGGEDYNLLITAPQDRVQELAETISGATGCPCSIAGEITPQSQGLHILDPEGNLLPWPAPGFSHF